MTPDEEKRRDVIGTVVLGGGWLLGGRIARIGVTLVGTAVLARVLTPTDFGILAIAMLTVTLSIAVVTGFVDVPIIRAEHLDRDEVANLYWTSVLILGVFAGLVWWGAAPLERALDMPRLAPVLKIVSVSILFQPFIVGGTAVLRREHRYAQAANVFFLAAVLYNALAILFALLGWSVYALAVGQSLSVVLTALIVLFISRTPAPPPRRLRPRRAIASGGMAGTARLLSWASTNVDTLAASLVLSPATVAFYTRAYNITTQAKEPITLIDQTVRQAFVARRDLALEEKVEGNLKGLRLVSLVSCLVAGALVAFRETIVLILLGDQWLAAIPLLAILALSLPPRAIRVYLDALTFVDGKIGFLAIRNLLILVLLGAALLLFASRGAAAIGWAVGAVLHLSLLMSVAGRHNEGLAGTLGAQFAAILPGYAITGLILIATETASHVVRSDSAFLDLLLRGSVYGLLLLIVIVLIPRRWLGERIAGWRTSLLGGQRTRKR